MEKVSAVVIVYNEEKNLPGCLDSLKWADEIVVVDSHSTDRTVEIARRYTDRVLQKDYQGHIDKKRFAVSQAAHDWVFSLDADERPTPELVEEVRGVLAGKGEGYAGFDMPRITWHLGRWIRHGEWYPDRVTRLFRRSLQRYEGTEPHDKVVLEGKRGRLRGRILHYNYRDFAHQIERVQAYSEQAAKAMDAEGRSAGVWNLALRPAFKFLKCYVLRLGFLDGWAGFIIAVASAFYVHAKYAKLYERRKGCARGDAPPPPADA
ncbi:MAG: glycosyltransferase family 2 protein [Planctomycetes bacterium]|jgi:glycosyltransferase involved in cell wall biosynthesis|nr:glycosyltransferase family 2 protein [Planctomycetota bacterium]